MVVVKRFAGRLNKDNREQDLLSVEHLSAKNGRFYGGEQGLTFENIVGNYLIPNSNLPAGTNECNGAFYDSVNRRILWFNYNSNGNHGLYQFLIETQAVTQIFRCGVNSVGDVLNLSLDRPVHSMAIVYRTEGDGDLLYWINGEGVPQFLNLDTVATYSPFTEDMLNAAKNAPTKPPGSLSFQDDVTVTYNAVRNKQFRFAYRWVYANDEKSTFSPISITPITDVADPNAETDPTVDNYIQFDVYSADTEDSTAIEVFMQEWNGASWGDFQRIDSLDRAQYNINVSSSYTYKFYNNGSYVFVDPQESDLYFTWLPPQANTLEALNGNVIIYGGITEGYPNLQRDEVDVTVTSTLVAANGKTVQAWDWAADQIFGLVYFDAIGRTSGVISFITDSAIDTTDFSVTTPQYTGSSPIGSFGTVPQISATINHTPPTWAVAYQWVRVNLTPEFTYTITMDLQSDATYWYLGIQNLIEMNANDGFLPSYEFAEGDRVRVIANWGGNGLSVPFSTQQDYPVLAVVDRTMTTPATTGKFIKIPKLASSTPAYTNKMFIKLYTPLKRVPANKQLFYEWGQRYAIYESGGNRYHRGQLQDQTGSQPATFAWTDGDVYAKYRGMYTVLPVTSTTALNYLYMMDKRWNDYVPTEGNSNGRAWTIDENAATIYNPVGVRWGGKYQSGTSINQLNIFRPADFDEVDRSKGTIQRFKVRDRILRVFQDRGVGQYGIYANFIQTNSQNPDLTTTNAIITINNVQYYNGNYGLCGYPTNLVSAQNADYFNDVVTGRAIRLAPDGLTDLGLLYKGQYHFSSLVTPYNKEILRSDGSISKVMGFFDYFENQYHTILQGGTNSFGTYASYNFSFNEGRNAFCSDDYDYHPEWAIGADDKVYTWVSGQLYKHDSVNASGAAVPYCNFYGIQKDCEITVVFNENLIEKKSWQAITEVASDTWDCPVIYTNVMSYGTQRQQTSLVAAEFTKLEQNPSSAIKRDAFSRGGKINGQAMKGNWIAIKFRKENAQSLINLSELQIAFVDSPLTRKQ